MKPKIDQGRIQDLSRGVYRASENIGIWGANKYFFNPKVTNTDIQLLLSHLEYKSTLMYFTIRMFEPLHCVGL